MKDNKRDLFEMMNKMNNDFILNEVVTSNQLPPITNSQPTQTGVAQQQPVAQTTQTGEDKQQSVAPASTIDPTKLAGDVKGLYNATKLSTSMTAADKRIDNIAEFPGAFSIWFDSLGFTPQTLSRSTALNVISSALIKMGYK